MSLRLKTLYNKYFPKFQTEHFNKVIEDNQKDYYIPKKDSYREEEKVKPKTTKTTIEDSWWYGPLAYGIYRLIRAYFENN